jgi:hypothetical protein
VGGSVGDSPVRGRDARLPAIRGDFVGDAPSRLPGLVATSPYRLPMSDDIDDVVTEMADFIADDPPPMVAVPDGVGDAEAVHAVQKHYAEAGFECDEAAARSVIRSAR